MGRLVKSVIYKLGLLWVFENYVGLEKSVQWVGLVPLVSKPIRARLI